MTTVNIDDLVAKLQKLDASLGDARDVLNTADAQARFWGEKRAIAGAISGLRNAPDDLEKPERLLAEFEARRQIVREAQAELERLIEQQTDWRTVVGSRAERDREWGRQQDLLASRRALANGVEFFSGVAAVPNALKKILGVVVEADGREVPNWYGSVTEVEEQITKWASRRDAARSALDSHVKAAEVLLAQQPVAG